MANESGQDPGLVSLITENLAQFTDEHDETESSSWPESQSILLILEVENRFDNLGSVAADLPISSCSLVGFVHLHARIDLVSSHSTSSGLCLNFPCEQVETLGTNCILLCTELEHMQNHNLTKIAANAAHAHVQITCI